MDVSIIVPVYNSRKFLPGLIKSLLSQDFHGSYEIIIVDDGSTDGTDGLMKTVPSKKLHYIKQANSGPASARNTGLKRAHGRIIAFTDGDCMPERDWISEMVRSFGRGVDAVEGRIETRGKVYPDSHFIKNHNGGMFLTSNIAYLRSKIRQFDRRYRYPNREDSDIAFDVLSKGGRIVFSSNVIVRHVLLKSSLKSMLKRKLYFESDALLFKKYPILYKQRIRFPFEKFTPFYIIFALAGFSNPLLWLALPVIALAEIVYRKYSFGLASFVKFLVAQALGSFVNLYAIAIGCIRYRINPIRILL